MNFRMEEAGRDLLAGQQTSVRSRLCKHRFAWINVDRYRSLSIVQTCKESAFVFRLGNGIEEKLRILDLKSLKLNETKKIYQNFKKLGKDVILSLILKFNLEVTLSLG